MRSSIVITLLFFVPILLKGQENTWKKEVSRLVNIPVAHSYKARDSSLAEIMLSAVESNRVVGYIALSRDFQTKITSYELKWISCNPEVNDRRSVREHRRLLRDSIYQYRVYEEWTFDKRKNVTIKMTYVAPVRNVYGEDGRPRGMQPIFIISYNDFLLITNRHPRLQRQLNKAMWSSYFKQASEKILETAYDAASCIWYGSATSMVPVTASFDTTVRTYDLRNEHADSPLLQLIESRILSGRMDVWYPEPAPFVRQMTPAGYYKYIFKVDTQVVVDPVTGNEEMKLPAASAVWRSSHYFILQSWTFDPTKGKTNIELRGLAPADRHYGGWLETRGPMFWVQYKSILPLINLVEQYYPERSFSMQLWNSFFTSNTKPVLQK